MEIAYSLCLVDVNSDFRPIRIYFFAKYYRSIMDVRTIFASGKFPWGGRQKPVSGQKLGALRALHPP